MQITINKRLKQRTLLMLAACALLAFMPCKAAQEKDDSAAKNAAAETKPAQTWFSWWGPAKQDTNAPLTPKSEPIKVMTAQPVLPAATQPQPETALPETTKNVKPETASKPAQTWFSWWGPAKQDTNALTQSKQPEKKIGAAGKAKKDPAESGGEHKTWLSWWGRAKAPEASSTKTPAKETQAKSPTLEETRRRRQFERAIQASTNETSGKATLPAPPPPPDAQAHISEKTIAKQQSLWRFSAGVLQRNIGRTSMTASDSYSRRAPIPNQSANGSSHNNNAGSTRDFADRVYDNGYVSIDEWTVLDGGTTIWGFEHAGQIHNGYVEFTALSGVERKFHRETETSDAGWNKPSDREWSGLAAVDWLFYQNRGFLLGLGLSASRVSFSGSGAGTTFTDRQAWQTYTTTLADRYNIAGTGLTPGAQPTSWSSSQHGPVIDNIPTHRHRTRQLTASGSYEAFNAISQKMSMDLYTVSVGLSLGFEWWRLIAAGMAGPTVNYVDAEGVYNETLYASADGGETATLNSWRASRAEAEFMAGFYLQAGLFFDIITGVQLGVFGRYDWVEDFLGAVGPAAYTVSPSGGSYGASIGMSF